MKYIDWDTQKNDWLKRERRVSFEEVVEAIFHGVVLGTSDHPNQKKYPNQQVYIVSIHDYAYVIPYMENEEKIFLKTIFPSRKYTRDLIEKGVV